MKSAFFTFLFAALISLGSPHLVRAQRVAILNPEKDALADQIADEVENALSKTATIIERSMGDTAFRSANISAPFNLSLEDSKLVGTTIGCNAFVLIKAQTLKRTSSVKTGYFESYTAIFVVSTRTGHLAWWKVLSAEADTAADSERRLLESACKVNTGISRGLKEWLAADAAPEANPIYPDIPAEDSLEAKGFLAPIPYLRIKPEYTNTAFLYDVKGTVEVTVDLDDKGNIVRTEIARWAGFGLDEAVIAAVRKMNWRPGTRNGKTLPTHFLLRYNFKKSEKE